MEKIVFLTFGNERFYGSLERLREEAKCLKIFNEILIINDKILQEKYPEFWEKHSDFILNNKRGYGFWIWKSYLILKVLESLNENDIVVYADAGCSLNKDGIDRLNYYFDLVRKSDYGILSFELGHLEKTYTKRDLFVYLGMNYDEYLNSYQLMATSIILKKCAHSMNIISTYYETMCNYSLIDNSPSVLENDGSFVEHRHDQSVLSLLRKKYGSVVIPDETWYPDWDLEYIKKFPILAKRLC